MVIAHQGGWDEALFVLAPLLLFGVLLWLARRRIDLDDDPLDEPDDAERETSG